MTHLPPTIHPCGLCLPPLPKEARDCGEILRHVGFLLARRSCGLGNSGRKVNPFQANPNHFLILNRQLLLENWNSIVESENSAPWEGLLTPQDHLAQDV